MRGTSNTAADKILKILLSFAPHNQEKGTVEISQQLGYHTATVSRNLQILTDHGFLQKNPKTKKYGLGRSIIILWEAVRHSLNTDLIHIAKPFLDDLRNKLQESVVLETLSGDRAVIVYIAEINAPLGIRGNIGDQRLLHAAAGGKAILAFSSQHLQERILNSDLKRLTPNTMTDPVLLRENLLEIKQRGYSLDNEEVYVGIYAIGVPVFNYENIPVASVVVAGPASRMKMKNELSIVTRLKKTAKNISSQFLFDLKAFEELRTNDKT